MLVYIFAFILGLSPALQAVFDLPLQLALQRAVLAGFLLWLFLRARGAGLPAMGRRFLPLWGVAAFSFASMMCSPFRGYIFNEWGNFAAGLMVFLWASFASGEERERVGRAVLWGGWLVFAISLLQAFVLGNFWTLPPLTNFNALALYAVMLIPVALSRGAWPLAAAMTVLVIWTQSLGAALAGVTAAVLYVSSRRGESGLKENALVIGALALLAVAAAYLLQGDSIAGRLAWWRTAWEMFSARPLAGFGHAAFSWAASGFQAAGSFREYSIYAHNYYLEFLAENGLPAALAWFWLLYHAVRARAGLEKYAVIAALVHSFIDFGLSVPANFWLFCWLLSAGPGGGEQRELKIPRGFVTAGMAFALLLFAALLSLDRRSLGFEKARRLAAASVRSGNMEAVPVLLEPYARSSLFRAPALEVMARAYSAGVREWDHFYAAVTFEQLLLENPYAPSAWKALGGLYSAPGWERTAADLKARRREVYR